MSLLIRQAERQDIFQIHKLVSSASIDDESLLNRGLADIAAHIDTFLVGEVDGALVGCVAIHPYSPRLCEVRSQVIDTRFQGCGWGSVILRAAVEAGLARYSCVWIDAKKPDYFLRTFGGRAISRFRMPAGVLFKKLRWVFGQERDRWIPSLTGRFTLLEMKA